MVLAIKEVEVAGERFMKMADALLVASKSEPGTWHRIDGATCQCKGFQYRGHCRHLAAALELGAVETDTCHVTIEITTEYGGGWAVKWLGYQHGGTHSYREDAEAHADELRQAPAWDAAGWLERHGSEAPGYVPPTPGHVTTRPKLRVLEGGRSS